MSQDSIFAPWRMEWVQRERDTGTECIFCSISDGPDDRENRVVARGPNTFVVLNNAPYTPGHLMVVPDDHVGDFVTLPETTLTELVRVQQRSVSILKEVFAPDGFNVGMNIGEAGGASIDDHLHVHVIPRWESDTTFMPTVADTNVVVEALDETYTRLHRAFADEHGSGDPDDDSAVHLSM